MIPRDYVQIREDAFQRIDDHSIQVPQLVAQIGQRAGQADNQDSILPQPLFRQRGELGSKEPVHLQVLRIGDTDKD